MLLRARGWPEPEATLDWLEHRRTFMDGDGNGSE
jgi:hypothetical protein